MILFLVTFSCTNKKNTIVTRTFHNITSRFNGFYWATESINDGVFKIEQGHKDDFNKVLPMFIYPDNVSCKTIFPEMDRAIKKSSTVIQRHTIKDKKTKEEVPGAVRWIDDNWLVIGQAHFYKREFFSGVEVFEYVAKTYKSKQRYEAKLWLIRTFNEIGTLSQAEPILADLKNDKNFPKQFNKNLQGLITEFYLKQGLYDEAIKSLEKTISLTKKKKTKARFSFIMAQLLEIKKDNKKAIAYYDKCIHLKPNYDMLIQAKIKKSRLYDGKDTRSKGAKQELLKMASDPKNEEYLDVIYFTLGEMEEKANQIDQAMAYFKKSAQSSVNNNNQKAASYLKLADNSFEKTNYVAASSYYDSTVAVLDKKHPDYENIINKQKNLGSLIQNINTIKIEDSLQKVASMDSASRNKIIMRLIQKVKEEEELKKEELEKLKDQNQNNNINQNNGATPTQNFNSGEWYMYNQQTKAFGINDFVKKFGNRKLEDNWRRSNKQSSTESLSVDAKEEDSTSAASKNPKENDKTSIEYYLKPLPLSKEKMELSSNKIFEAYYQLGSIYREALNNHQKAISTFEEMNKRFLDNKYEANTLYQSYRMCVQDKNNSGSEKYKSLLLKKYPESDYARILKDPDFQSAVNAKKSEIEQFYEEAYNLYSENKIILSLEKCKTGLIRYGSSELGGKIALLRSLCIGRLQGMDSMAIALTAIISKYSKDLPVKNKASELLEYINQQKGKGASNGINKESELFTFNETTEHFWVCVLPKEFNGENSFKAKLSDYNNKYYSNNILEVNSIQYNQQGLVFVKKFKDKQTGMAYFEGLEENNEPFDGSALAKNKSVIFIITQENFQKIVQQKKLFEYLDFFQKKYLPGLEK